MEKEYDLSNFSFPETYVADGAVARNVADSVYQANIKFWERVDKIQRHLDGERPIDPKKLKEKALSWSNNWNYYKATSKIQKGTLENIASIRKALMLATINFRRSKEEDEQVEETFFLTSDELRGIYSSKIARVFIDTLEREKRFDNLLNVIEYNTYTFGWCPVTKDQKDWMGVAHHIRNVGFPDKTRPDEIEKYVVFDHIRGRQLWEQWVKIKKSSVTPKKRDNGSFGGVNSFYNSWCLEGIEESLYYSYKGELEDGDKDTSRRGMRYEVNSEKYKRQLNDLRVKFCANPSLVCEDTDKVNIAKIYNFEFSENQLKFTITYIAYRNTWAGITGSAQNINNGEFSAKHILYQHSFNIDSQDDVINLIEESGFTVSGYIQEMSGIGEQAVQDSVRFNRKKNSIENKLLFAGSPMFTALSGQNAEALRITPSQGFVVAKEGLVLAPNQPRYDLTPHITSIINDERDYNRETQHFDPKLDNLTSRPNKSEVQVKQAEVSKLREARADVKITSYEKLFFNMFKALRKFTEDEKNRGKSGFEYFKEELLYEFREEGFDWDQIKKILDSVIDLQIEYIMEDVTSLQMLATLVETPYARRRLQRMIAIAIGTPRKEVDRLFPMATDNYRNLSDDRVAAIENDMFMETAEVVYSEDDDPVRHLNIHLPKFARTVEVIKNNGGDPVELFNYLTRLLEHSRLHLNKMERHPFYKKYFNDYAEAYQGFIKILKQLLPQIQRIAQQMAEQQQQGQNGGQGQIPEEERQKIQIEWFRAVEKEKLQKVRSDERAKQKEKEGEFRRQQKVVDQEFNQNLKRQQAEFETELQAYKTATQALTS